MALDVVEIRSKTKLNQKQFAILLGVPVSLLAEWEQGERIPEGTARMLLHMINIDSEMVLGFVARAMIHSFGDSFVGRSRQEIESGVRERMEILNLIFSADEEQRTRDLFSRRLREFSYRL